MVDLTVRDLLHMCTDITYKARLLDLEFDEDNYVWVVDSVLYRLLKDRGGLDPAGRLMNIRITITTEDDTVIRLYKEVK